MYFKLLIKRCGNYTSAISLRWCLIFAGETFSSLSYSYRMGERTISSIIEETCQALYAVMKDSYLQVKRILDSF